MGAVWSRNHVVRRLAALLGGLVILAGCGSGGGSDDVGPSDSSEASTGSLATDDSSPSTSPESSADASSPSSVPAVLDFRSETIAGEEFDGASLAGRPTVFWFWAPWCPTCRGQVSGVGELAETYGDEVNVVGIGSLDERGAIEEFASEVSPDVTLLADPDGAVWRHFGVTAQSTYHVLDATGREQASGYLDDAELAALVEDLAG